MRGLRKQHLPRIGECQQSAGPVEDEACQIVLTNQNLAEINGHTNRKRADAAPLGSGQPCNGLQGRNDRRVDVREEGQHSIAGVLEDPSAGLLDRGGDDLVVSGQRQFHAAPIRIPENGRIFNIGEEESGRTGLADPAPIQ